MLASHRYRTVATASASWRRPRLMLMPPVTTTTPSSPIISHTTPLSLPPYSSRADFHGRHSSSNPRTKATTRLLFVRQQAVLCPTEPAAAAQNDDDNNKPPRVVVNPERRDDDYDELMLLMHDDVASAVHRHQRGGHQAAAEVATAAPPADDSLSSRLRRPASSVTTSISQTTLPCWNRWDWASAYGECEEFPDGYWLEVTEGSLPVDLCGTFFRNGPGKLSVGDAAGSERVAHPFDAEGLVVSISIQDGNAFFRSKHVHTAE
eukprot:scaffold266654_cov15-Prasinocladus_malaysianus.AAC.1